MKILFCVAGTKELRVFSRDGHVKCSIYDSPGAVDIALSPDNNFHSIPLNQQHIKELNTTFITDVNNDISNVTSLTVDSHGKIIVGQRANSVSIHNADGSLISKFATQARPYGIAVTSNGVIVSSLYQIKKKHICAVDGLLWWQCQGNPA